MRRPSTLFISYPKPKESCRLWKVLMPWPMAGDPDLKTTEAVVLRMAESGADIIELGLPYSDPLADGPTIQAASQRALQRGGTLRGIFALAEGLKNTAP